MGCKLSRPSEKRGVLYPRKKTCKHDLTRKRRRTDHKAASKPSASAAPVTATDRATCPLPTPVPFTQNTLNPNLSKLLAEDERDGPSNPPAATRAAIFPQIVPTTPSPMRTLFHRHSCTFQGDALDLKLLPRRPPPLYISESQDRLPCWSLGLECAQVWGAHRLEHR